MVDLRGLERLVSQPLPTCIAALSLQRRRDRRLLTLASVVDYYDGITDRRWKTRDGKRETRDKRWET